MLFLYFFNRKRQRFHAKKRHSANDDDENDVDDNEDEDDADISTQKDVRRECR